MIIIILTVLLLKIIRCGNYYINPVLLVYHQLSQSSFTIYKMLPVFTVIGVPSISSTRPMQIIRHYAIICFIILHDFAVDMLWTQKVEMFRKRDTTLLKLTPGPDTSPLWFWSCSTVLSVQAFLLTLYLPPFSFLLRAGDWLSVNCQSVCIDISSLP